MKTYKTTIPQFNLRKIKTDFPKAKITSSRDGYEYIKQFYHEDIDIYESFFILMLNNSNNTIGYAKISQGGITGTVVDVRIVAKYCVESLATACILAHNHPSGKLKPSNADKSITQKLRDGLKLLDVKILDHLIITSENGYYSFSDENEDSL